MLPPRAVHWALLLGLCLLPGCGADAGPDVPPGRYRLYVEGSVTDTLRGTARLQFREQGRVGLELGPRNGPGLSIELVAETRDDPANRLPPGRYNVVATGLYPDGLPPNPSRPPEALVILSTGNAQFVGTKGHLSITPLNADAVGARLRVDMRSRHGGRPASRSIRVTGVLRASAP
jgi:hypothetical protein